MGVLSQTMPGWEGMTKEEQQQAKEDLKESAKTTGGAQIHLPVPRRRERDK